jgi:hypothetical protein
MTDREFDQRNSNNRSLYCWGKLNFNPIRTLDTYKEALLYTINSLKIN